MQHEVREVLTEMAGLGNRHLAVECCFGVEVFVGVKLSEADCELDPGFDEIEYVMIEVILVSGMHNIILGAMRKKTTDTAQQGCHEVA